MDYSNELLWVKTPRCTFCGNTSQVEVSENALRQLKNGFMVQEVFPDETPAFRELFISGVHEHCWISLFGDDRE